ncbi:ShlB/FhaC/HecB family hemolysin secretion/activation protein [Sphingomonas endolithica]|uniref:ShlB/FhaC/HecB family hemolysin secretion/activation protein n=1 Tax=Sphingomonas endolithica TaxID=2972485 RepID=UPI0021AEB737|nr:ShlB/FhaC/HecB family hemolysin secretion/activation protein [Sphingomonas sp. ZFBP2030]
MRRLLNVVLVGAGLMLSPSHAAGQVRLDRADPTIAEQALPNVAEKVDPAQAPATMTPSSQETRIGIAPTGPHVASAIVIGGAESAIPSQVFADIIVDYVGKPLLTQDFTDLLSRVSAKARSRGFSFATASISSQDIASGVLRVALDLGRIDAVRVIGTANPYADKLLTTALAGQVVRKDTLERAIGLVSDIPGVTVTDTKFVRQDGFGILLVTIAQDRASAYVQLDNRGSKEVGPIRSTILGNLRGVLRSGDEIGVIAALTPVQPSEFAFLRGRYTSPLGSAGSTVTVSGSYGRAHPGASLKPLDVIGTSWDLAMGYSVPILRSRTRSLWANLEVRTLSSSQTLLGTRLRRDKITTLTGTLGGNARAAGGVVRSELAIIAGLPVAGASHQEDALLSRRDGDARFVAGTYSVDWSRKVTKRISVVLASAGQLASRPLLASAEIGAGGPAFGRGYDYAERTGDSGILGSAEVRADLGRVLPTVIDRLQIYGFVDGGYVGNLRRGFGGGSLLSSGSGLRMGKGRLDGMIELALPMNADRFDTGNRRSRLSLRLSVSI